MDKINMMSSFIGITMLVAKSADVILLQHDKKLAKLFLNCEME